MELIVLTNGSNWRRTSRMLPVLIAVVEDRGFLTEEERPKSLNITSSSTLSPKLVRAVASVVDEEVEPISRGECET